MLQETFFIPSEQDCLPLSVLTVIPDGAAKGIFQLSHGMAENKERYLPLMQFIAGKGYICIIHDHRGHGASIRSQEDLGYMYENGDDAIVRDLHQISHYAKSRFPGLPLYLMGHSMGSLIVRCYLKDYSQELAALIVCGSPSFNPAAGIAIHLCNLLTRLYGDHHRSRLITGLAFGAYERKFPEKEANSWISANADNVREYNASPLCGFIFTTNAYHALFRLVQRTYSEKDWADARKTQTSANYALPVFFIAGEDDPCITSQDKFLDAIAFLKKQGFTDISHKLYRGMRHEIHNEAGKSEVWNDIADFIASH